MKNNNKIKLAFYLSNAEVIKKIDETRKELKEKYNKENKYYKMENYPLPRVLIHLILKLIELEKEKEQNETSKNIGTIDNS